MTDRVADARGMGLHNLCEHLDGGLLGMAKQNRAALCGSHPHPLIAFTALKQAADADEISALL